MNEEPRDWCVTEYPFSITQFYAKRQYRVGRGEHVVAENLSKDEAIALLSTIGEVRDRILDDDEYYVYVKELKNERSGK